MDKELVLIENSLLKCDKGSLLGILKVTSQNFVKVNEFLQATEKDCNPNENITPFGICSITQKPCVLNLLQWQHTFNFHLVNNMASLTEKSKIPCALGGMITPEIIPQNFYYIGTGEDSIQKEQEEQTILTKPILNRFFLTDLQGNEIEKGEIGQWIYLVIEGENIKGKTTDIDLSDKDLDFEYNGEYLTDDILKGYTFYGNKDQLLLKIIAPKNDTEI
ncbi:DUF4280 domain-containing protein [Capnocytophaga catalasegens]|uniref:DUF4280 domain-containing protein n=1 Tax=Capnocytophaga catalasegens TaxID=1004260 RepID=A0AAV5AXK0_9FLAO|nr:DUF4280 domain-containing protein [Capnocytophaga catalasegens]GIZ16048.1 hypothetical protein RCZ03_20480 [Capnocytophaga catalasegens]GJM50207.1 hypothetical protein RCZ15_11800 [Capnocytophaga catalasegens]GJM53438.1 hypothetical protein RCZ16_17540 [Capnocytophaga catalasegens]